MNTTIYGIKNCDTMKRARAWLDARGVSYHFHDYKSAGIDVKRLRNWSRQIGWEVLLNTRGTTWRKLSPDQRADMNEVKALQVMMENPSVIKRPVLEIGTSVLVGFHPERYAASIDG